MQEPPVRAAHSKACRRLAVAEAFSCREGQGPSHFTFSGVLPLLGLRLTLQQLCLLASAVAHAYESAC